MTGLILYVVGFLALCIVVARVLTNHSKIREQERNIYEEELKNAKYDS